MAERAASNQAETPARVLLACSGLEHANRGYESFARECFDTLRDHPLLDMQLIKGSGPARDRERSVPSLKRDGAVVRGLVRVTKRSELVLEQLAFGLSLQPEILRTKPDVIYFSEFYTGVALNHLRRVNRQQYALVLSNGSMAPDGFEPFDRVHQHTAPALEFVLARGADPTRQVLLPNACPFPDTIPSADERKALRTQLGLPQDRPVAISVAALNSWHKRLDYVIREVASMAEPRPFLLLVGHPEPETEALRTLAGGLLGDDGHSIRTVPRGEVDSLLRASDCFILASFAESLPRALVEAMGHGLPCLAHDYSVAHYALGPHGRLGDLAQPGALAGLLETCAGEEEDVAGASERQRFVRDKFSWDSLVPEYVDMLHGAVGRAPFR